MNDIETLPIIAEHESVPAVPLEADDIVPPDELDLIGVEADPLSGAELALWNALERLEATIDQETAQLRTMSATDFNRFNEAKSRNLLEVSRAVRAVSSTALDARLREKLLELRVKLDRNREAIAMHLDAVKEIASVMTGAAMDHESDGTYSMHASGRRRG